nr:MAG TPA: hypothetical protein [Caudoviricetes sp.]
MRPGWRFAALTAVVPRSLRSPVLRRAQGRGSPAMSCPAAARMIPLYSYSVVSRETREEGRKGGSIIPARLKMRRRTHHPTAPSP